MAKHKHQGIARNAKVVPYYEPARAPTDPKANPRAHGGTATIDFCSCDAERVTNRNGPHVEFGMWVDLND